MRINDCDQVKLIWKFMVKNQFNNGLKLRGEMKCKIEEN